jgi:hypothetical protein
MDDKRPVEPYANGSKTEFCLNLAFISFGKITMEQFPSVYTIRIQGRLHDRWKHWFDGMTITCLESGETVIAGLIEDQSALVGVINQIHSLNLRLISINCQEGNARFRD